MIGKEVEGGYFYEYERGNGEHWGVFYKVYPREGIREVVWRRDVEADVKIRGIDIVKDEEGRREIQRFIDDGEYRLLVELGEVIGVKNRSEIEKWLSQCERVSWKARSPFLSAREVLENILRGLGYRNVKVLVEEGGVMEMRKVFGQKESKGKNVLEDGVKYPTVVVRRIFTEFFGEGYPDRVEIKIYPTERGLCPVVIE